MTGMAELQHVPARAGVAGRRCAQCGGDVAFRPGRDAIACKFCDHVEPIPVDPQRRIVELSLDHALTTAPMGPAAELTTGGREVECKTCGARTVVTGQATRCAFCDAAVVIEIPDDRPQILPQSVLPFGVDQDAAKVHFGRWLASRWFAPSDLVRRSKAQGLDGVYLPYWTFDSLTTTHYTGERGQYYWVTESYTDSRGVRQTRSVRRTRWYSARGTVRVAFDDVLVCASRSLPEPLVDRLEPWDLPALRPFDDRYLAGFTAERYAVDLDAGFARAEQKMEPAIRTAIRREIGGDEQRIHSMAIHHEQRRFKHVLLPLWISAFHYHERVFRVTVNARTGEVSGERPWSWIKIALFSLLVAALVAGIAYLVHVSQPGG
jgi:hypothetical protein